MEVVIDIDDNLYTRLFDNGVDYYDDAVDMAKAIRKGVPLPKRHGRLIDADAVEKEMNKAEVEAERWADFYTADKIDCAMEYIINADTIIEADKKAEG